MKKENILIGGGIIAVLAYLYFNNKKSKTNFVAENTNGGSGGSGGSGGQSNGLPFIPLMNSVQTGKSNITEPEIVKPVSSNSNSTATTDNTTSTKTETVINTPTNTVVSAPKYANYLYTAYSGCTIQWKDKSGSIQKSFVDRGATSNVRCVLVGSQSGCGDWKLIDYCS